MKRTTTAIAMAATAMCTMASALQPAGPSFKVDPLWPKPLPNHWVLGNVIGVGVDDRDHIFIVHRNDTFESAHVGRAFLNVPLIPGTLGLRMSAFSASHGGFIDNLLTTRTWVNGTVSNNALWARNNYNRQETAAELNINRTTLYKKMRKYHLDIGEAN